jgi:hypothetical protein
MAPDPEEIPVDLARAAWRGFLRASGGGTPDVRAMQRAIALIVPELGARHVAGLSAGDS